MLNNTGHKQLLDSLNKGNVIMHPGPINRGVEITQTLLTQICNFKSVENGCDTNGGSSSFSQKIQ
jgi:aspartate carbamoyltransferase catalytic subunit